jgi:hypothetical protein
MLKVLGGRLQMFFELSEAEEKCVKDLNFFDFLNVRSPAYLP